MDQEKTISKWECGNGRRFIVQEYYEGITYRYHEAPEKLQKRSAVMLAQIHGAMKELENLPTGIGEEFLNYRNTRDMQESYARTLHRAQDAGDGAIAERIRVNKRIVQTMPDHPGI